MKLVKRIVSESCIGQTREGHEVEANQVEYSDGTIGTLYRLNRGEGQICGLQTKCPAMMGCRQGLLIEVAK